MRECMIEIGNQVLGGIRYVMVEPAKKPPNPRKLVPTMYIDACYRDVNNYLDRKQFAPVSRHRHPLSFSRISFLNESRINYYRLVKPPARVCF